jgi:hypothetical protein
MAGFYENLAPEDVAALDRLAMLLIELRESHMTLLARYAVASEDDLYDRLRAGSIAEHTAYEDYLGARIIESTRQAVRAQLRDYMLQLKPDGSSGILHARLSDSVVSHYGERLAGAPRQSLDALILQFDSGLGVELRCANAHEYSIYWQWPGGEGRIDTAPGHAGLATGPHHLHAVDGSLRADPLTQPGREPWENLRAVLDALLQDPRLETAG